MLTVSREYGSGGARIANMIAQRTGWALLDAAIIDEVARLAKVDPRVAREKDERVDSWFHRLNKNALRATALTAGIDVEEADFFDTATMAAMAREVIQQAHALGNCVIVGRGAQCVLSGRADVFRVFVYAPQRTKVDRLRTRHPEGTNIEELMRAVDDQRVRYIQRYFGRQWNDLLLYDLLISSEPGEEETASTIIYAMGAKKGG